MCPSRRWNRGESAFWETHPLARDVPAERLRPPLAAVSGYLVHLGTLPPPPGLSTVREFQRAQGVEALAWLRRSLGAS